MENLTHFTLQNEIWGGSQHIPHEKNEFWGWLKAFCVVERSFDGCFDTFRIAKRIEKKIGVEKTDFNGGFEEIHTEK